MFSLGESVLLNVKGINHVRDTFGNLSGLEDPWTVTGRTSASLAPTYTLQSKRGIRFEGVKEDFLAPAPIQQDTPSDSE